MADLKELNESTPAKPQNATHANEAESVHRRVEREADKMADKANRTEKRDDQDEFSNIGPA